MYGTGPDLGEDVSIRGKVLSESTNAPIPGIKVSVKDLYSDANTDENGDFVIYLPRQDEYKLKFEDVDGAANGSFQQKKMKITLENTSAPLDIILENIILDERNEE
jgi:putative lipoprotein (rSAM/lipoprotein system)